MSPEQALGELDKIGPLSDVYSLGALLYCLLVGKPPFSTATHSETLRQVINHEPPSLRNQNPQVPRDLEAICLKCLAKERKWRYESAAEFAEDVKRFIDGKPIKARPVSRVNRVWRWCRRNPLAASLLLSLLLSGYIAAALIDYQRKIADGNWQLAEGRRERAEKAEKVAIKRHREAEQRLVQLYLTSASQALYRGDTSNALPGIVGARQLMRVGDKERRIHNQRLAMALRSTPLVLQAWRHGSDAQPYGTIVTALEWVPQKQWVLSAGSDGSVLGFDMHNQKAFEVPITHPDKIDTLVVDAQGKRMVTVSMRKAFLWDLPTCKRIGSVSAEPGRLRIKAAIDAAGRRFATASGRTVRIWNAHDASTVGHPVEHREMVNRLYFSPNGKWLLTTCGGRESSNYGAARLFDATTGKELTTNGGMRHGDDVLVAAFCTCGEHILTTSHDRILRVWRFDGSNLSRANEFTHKAEILRAVFGPSGRRILAAGRDRQARVYGLRDRSLLTLPHDGPVLDAEFLPGGNRAVTVSFDGKMQVFDVENGSRVYSPAYHAGAVRMVRVIDKTTIATSGDDGIVRIWRLPKDETRFKKVRFPSNMQHIALSADRRRVLAASGIESVGDTHVVALLDGFGKVLHGPATYSDQIVSVGLHPTEAVIAAGTIRNDLTGNLSFVEVTNGRLTNTRSVGKWAVFETVFSRDGSALLTCGFDRIDDTNIGRYRMLSKVRLYDTGSRRKIWEKDVSGVKHADVSHDGKWAVAGCDNGMVQILKCDDDTISNTLGRLDGAVSIVKFSPDSTIVAAASINGTVEMWRLADGKPVGTALRHGAQVVDVAFSSDGKRIATASHDLTARIWDVETGFPQSPSLLHDDIVRSVAFREDGSLLATGCGGYERGSYGQARMWDAMNGQPVTPPLHHGDDVMDVEFLASDSRIVTASWDRGVRYWNIGLIDGLSSWTAPLSRCHSWPIEQHA